MSVQLEAMTTGFIIPSVVN